MELTLSDATDKTDGYRWMVRRTDRLMYMTFETKFQALKGLVSFIEYAAKTNQIDAKFEVFRKKDDRTVNNIK